MKGAGKKVCAFIPFGHKIEPELMYKMLDCITNDMQGVLSWLKEGGAQDDAPETLADVLAEMERLGEKRTDDPSPNTTECLGLIVLRYRARIMSAIARQPSAGHVVEMGNLAESLSRHIADSLPYVEREVVAGVIAVKVPEVGIMVRSSREEIQSIAGNILYKDVIITPKETKEETK